MKLWFLAALLATLQGCALTVSDPRALTPLDSFAPLAGESRVWVEPGVEAYGARGAEALPDAIARVEAAHYLPFSRPPRVYVCGSAACFKRHVLTPKLSAAVVPDNRLVLSPNLDGRESHRLPALLTHELAHLHLGQRIGHYHSTLPVWFHEGWASLVADGGGADYATDARGFEAIQAGKRDNLTARATPGKRPGAAASRLISSSSIASPCCWSAGCVRRTKRASRRWYSPCRTTPISRSPSGMPTARRLPPGSRDSSTVF